MSNRLFLVLFALVLGAFATEIPYESPVPTSSYPFLALSLNGIGLIALGSFLIGLVTTSGSDMAGKKSLVREVGTAFIAAVFLGTGILFTFLWTGVYV